MIGVIAGKAETDTAKEFFELFKTPWEFYRHNQSYDIILSTKNDLPEIDAKLVILYSSEKTRWDGSNGIIIQSSYQNAAVTDDIYEIPVYGKLSTFETLGLPLIKLQENSQVVGQLIENSNTVFVRIGFDLFKEVQYLLREGQPPDKAQVPTLDIHISLLRDWILAAGLPVVEIPPVPAGYNFLACLTHDVDFVGIKQHKFDHTMWGFLYRALVVSLLNTLKGIMPLNNLLKNWKAALSLPLVHLGLARDFWDNFDKYSELEKDYKSTFFIIPFKKKTGENVCLANPERRATYYDVTDVRESLHQLLRKGFEVGLHGIDAWHSPDRAAKEFERIVNETGASQVGVRMHWLCFDDMSPGIIDKAGFCYDSTFGYNETVGYRGGTSQTFRPPGTKNLLELPLHIQDMALFAPALTDMSETEAWEACEKIIKNASNCGGVLTLLWHMRSIAPERLWDDFYKRLLNTLKENGAWFATASQAVDWFKSRREVTFGKIVSEDGSLRLHLKHKDNIKNAKLLFRIHVPEASKSGSFRPRIRIIDTPWSGEADLRIPLN